MRAMRFNLLHGIGPNGEMAALHCHFFQTVRRDETSRILPGNLLSDRARSGYHGIAFGQDLIDGKFEGLSVTDMKVEKRHGLRRFHVQFPTVVSGHTNMRDPDSCSIFL